MVCESTPLGTDSEERKGATLTQKKTVNGGLVAKTPGSQRRRSGLDPWSGNKTPHATIKTGCSQVNK